MVYIFSALSVLSAVPYFMASRILPLGDTDAINNLSPIAVIIIAWIFLNEKVGWKDIRAGILGLIGIVLITKP